MPKICPQFRYCLRRKQKEAWPHLLFKADGDQQWRKKAKARPESTIWSITDDPPQNPIPFANSMFCTIFSLFS